MITEIDFATISLNDLFKLVSDPRSSQGLLYPLHFLLNCAEAAFLCGAKGFRQIGEWVSTQSFDDLSKLGNKYRRKPCESTFRKCFEKLDISVIRDLVYKWTEAKVEKDNVKSNAIAIDGKTLRGSRNSDDRQPHMLSATYHESGIMLKDLLVGNKKSEIQFIQPLLDEINISGKCITADALHTIKDFCVFLRSKDANYVFIAKGNKKKLIDRLKMLEIEKNFCDFDETVDTKHGRIEIRKVYLLSELPFWLCFKTAEQVFVIERTTVNKKTGKKFSEKHFGLTSFTKKQATASDIQNYIRGHWTIENKAFHVRDRTMGEDQSTVKRGILPEIMVLFRNLALNLFRFKKKKNIAQAIRECGFYPEKSYRLILN